MYCCCNRKANSQVEMLGRHSCALGEEERYLSDVYELRMLPCVSVESSASACYTPTPKSAPNPRRTSVYVNVFEESDADVSTPTSPSTPRNPVVFSDVHGNTIHVQIPRGSQLYVNYENNIGDSPHSVGRTRSHAWNRAT